MKVDTNTLTAFLLFFSHAQQVIALPQVVDVQLVERAELVAARDDIFADGNALMKRKGGGGGGGKGGGSSSSGSGSSGSSGSSGTSSSGSGSSKPGGTSSTSNGGGTSKGGSGVRPSYGGGRYYGGGATSPYRSGVASPLGITPFLFAGAALAFWPGVWLYGAYSYPYHNNYSFRNHSANSTNTKRDAPEFLDLFKRQDTGVQQSKPVNCFCAQYQVCGCDDNGNTTFLDTLVGDGDYNKLNKTLITVADVNGTSTILINGTLPNGTTINGASSVYGSQRFAGYWVMIALVGGMVYFV